MNRTSTPLPLGLRNFLDSPHAAGDFWGALAAMLVALPASIAFGVTVYAAISPTHAASGALAGVIGAAVIGFIAATLGGTDRLISAPCAPAAAVLTAFAIELTHQGIEPDVVILLLVMLGILAGSMQMLLGFVGIGRLIRYIPYPVVSGYLSAVGLILIASQLPKLVGAPAGSNWRQILLDPGLWDIRSLAIAAATILTGVLAPRLTQRIPGTILGILAGVLTYFALASQDAALLELVNNPLVIGPLGAATEGHLASISGRWQDIGQLHLAQVAGLAGNALTLAVLLSIDTLKTCVMLDQLTRSRHAPDRELVAQGLANAASAAIGGMPGSGTTAATLVNLSSGAKTRASGVIEGVLALATALLLGSFLAWLPVATLAATLLVIGVRMIDREPLRFIESRATVFDFAVVLMVVIVALSIGLIAAFGVGVAMAMLLFVREQIGGSVIRHKIYANQTSSTWRRPESERAVLAKKGDQAVIFELQGSLFFGTTQKLYNEIEPELASRHFVILDFRRVQSFDVTAAQMLRNIRDILQERGAQLLLSGMTERLSNGRNLHEFLEQTGVIISADTEPDALRIFSSLDETIEWVEGRLLGEIEIQAEPESLMELHEMALFHKRKDETLKDLESRMTQRHFQAGETIYTRGEGGTEVYWLRRGTVRIFAAIGGGRTRHVASFGRGDFFGSLAFLDSSPHDNDAIALTDCDVYALSREQFYSVAEEHKKLALNLVIALARTLALRVRHAESELILLREY
jgi:SulP family sulfate permease